MWRESPRHQALFMTEASGGSATYRRSIVIDARDPTFLTNRQLPIDKGDYWDRLSMGGVTACLVDVPWTDDDFTEAAVNFGAWHERVSAAKGRARIVLSTQDIVDARAAGSVGIVLTSQTPTIIEDDLRLLRPLYELGLRVCQLAYQRRTLVGDSCSEPAELDGGLGLFGRSVVAEMNRLGIAIDLSHASDRTMDQAIALSSKPVLASHSNARSFCDHRRNIPDATLRQLADKGGVCCVSAYSEFLVAGGSRQGTTVADMARMVRHLAGVVGYEHVGFGLDVGEHRSPEEVRLIGGSGDIAKRYALLSRTELWTFADALHDEGCSDNEIEAILGGNLLRFFRDVWGD